MAAARARRKLDVEVAHRLECPLDPLRRAIEVPGALACVENVAVRPTGDLRAQRLTGHHFGRGFVEAPQSLVDGAFADRHQAAKAARHQVELAHFACVVEPDGVREAGLTPGDLAVDVNVDMGFPEREPRVVGRRRHGVEQPARALEPAVGDCRLAPVGIVIERQLDGDARRAARVVALQIPAVRPFVCRAARRRIVEAQRRGGETLPGFGRPGVVGEHLLEKTVGIPPLAAAEVGRALIERAIHPGRRTSRFLVRRHQKRVREL